MSNILHKMNVQLAALSHMRYADNSCNVSLTSAGLHNLLSIKDNYCDITCNVRKYVCIFSDVALTSRVIMPMYSY